MKSRLSGSLLLIVLLWFVQSASRVQEESPRDRYLREMRGDA